MYMCGGGCEGWGAFSVKMFLSGVSGTKIRVAVDRPVHKRKSEFTNSNGRGKKKAFQVKANDRLPINV